MQMTYTLS